MSLAVLAIAALVLLRNPLGSRSPDARTGSGLVELIATADAIGGLTWVVDADGRCVFVASSWSHLMDGGEAVSTSSPPIAAALHPDDAEATLASWHAAWGAVEPFTADHRLRMPSGEYRWFRSRAAAVRDRAGRTIGWIGISCDVDDLRGPVQDRPGLSVVAFPAPESHELPLFFDEVTGFRLDAIRRGPASPRFWYDAIPLSDGRVFICVGRGAIAGDIDESEHLGFVRRALLEAGALDGDPARVLAGINRVVLLRRGAPVIALCGFVDVQREQLLYATAGHAGPYVGSPLSVRRLPGGGRALGELVGVEYPIYHAMFEGELLAVIDTDLPQDQRAAELAHPSPLRDAIRLAARSSDAARAIERRLQRGDEDASLLVLTMRREHRAARACHG